MLIFVSSIGRSGTRYLSELVRSMTTIPAYHLAEPYCRGAVYEAINRGETPEELTEKVDRVLSVADSAGGWYFESTPVFVRGFGEAVLETGRPVGVIQLLRDPYEVAKSYVNRDSYPSHPGRPWRLPLNLPRADLRVGSGLTHFQENLADWTENELRLNALRDKLFVIEPFMFTDLNCPAQLAGILAGWGVPLRDTSLSELDLDLDRNANPVPSLADSEEAEAAEALLRILDGCEFDRSLFALPRYDGFEWARKLRRSVSTT